MKHKVENMTVLTGRQSQWMAALNYLETTKRLSLWNSRCWSASSMMTLQSTWSSGYFLLLTMHNNRRSGGTSSSHQQAWQQNNCFKDKEKVIANFYLRHYLRALRMFLSPMEKAGRYGERSTEASTLHHILNFLDGCWLRPRPSFEYPLIWHIQVRNWSVIDLESLRQEWTITITLSNLWCITTLLISTQQPHIEPNNHLFK